ncbi:PREDICTED: uncharacterized protein LOC105564797 [Vollenhovia emeryi]|uniref:uncharacterized protein LOC105564797 n=1 Tax=Vollenhovia emeryi TaxID=411798 RepID=UPI0005F47B14|nr:PREDICTED: uncharacterized protein LOC105564797 [Vollenhovia emeryi]
MSMLAISCQANLSKMLFYLSLIVASPILITAFPQNSADGSSIRQDGFIFDGPVASGQPNGQQKITSTSTTVMSTTLSDDLYNVCLGNCPTTQEYNPVCGTDKIDYTNPVGLGCAQRCGKDVTLNYYGRCSTGRTG